MCKVSDFGENLGILSSTLKRRDPIVRPVLKREVGLLMVSPLPGYALLGLMIVASQATMSGAMAQTVPMTSDRSKTIDAPAFVPQLAKQSLPEQSLSEQSLPEELLPPPDLSDRPPSPGMPPLPESVPAGNDLKFRVDRFEILGNTRFTAAQLETITAPFAGRELSFAEVLQVRSAITKLYTDAGYVTTGAIVAPQAMRDGVLQIQVVEGQLEAIQVSGNRRLRTQYIRDRIKPNANAPLNVPDLLEQL